MDNDIGTVQKMVVSLLTEISEKNYELSLSVGKLRRYVLSLDTKDANFANASDSAQGNITGFKPDERPLIIERIKSSYGVGNLKEQASVASGLSNKAAEDNESIRSKE